jgi:hypothetical protein
VIPRPPSLHRRYPSGWGDLARLLNLGRPTAGPQISDAASLCVVGPSDPVSPQDGSGRGASQPGRASGAPTTPST